MNPSAPSDSSDPTFVVGTDLVQFDRPELPIYQTAEAAPWTCFDEAPYGAPLDRLFGEPGNVHIDGTVRERVEQSLGSGVIVRADPSLEGSCAHRFVLVGLGYR